MILCEKESSDRAEFDSGVKIKRNFILGFGKCNLICALILAKMGSVDSAEC